MSQIAVKDLRNDVQQYVSERKIDYNGNGYIDSDNGELSRLLSDSGVKDVSKIYRTGKLRAPLVNTSIAALVLGSGNSALLYKTGLINKVSNITKFASGLGTGLALAVSAFFAYKAIETKESQETLLFQKQ